ncbi:MAG: hypothetical protein ACTSVY_09875 [Candidatus Helarchaeota archaeon]
MAKEEEISDTERESLHESKNELIEISKENMKKIDEEIENTNSIKKALQLSKMKINLKIGLESVKEFEE